MKLLWSEKVQGEFLPARVEEDRGKRGKWEVFFSKTWKKNLGGWAMVIERFDLQWHTHLSEPLEISVTIVECDQYLCFKQSICNLKQLCHCH
jgi:hypothetical protein